MPAWGSPGSRHGAPEENRTSSQVRTDGADSRSDRCLHEGDLQATRRLPLPEPALPWTTSDSEQYARLVSRWIAGIGLDTSFYGTHSLRRTKATLIYRRTANLRAVQLLLGHRKIESTVRYLGIEVDDALAIAEQVDV